MHELISHPGLQFYVDQLSGQLTYSLKIANRPPRDFELTESDFEDTDPQVKTEDDCVIQGLDASAVGLKLKLVKNDGLLKMSFMGTDGGSAEWTFEGLQEPGNLCAAASMQTRSTITEETGTQTVMKTADPTGTQTEMAQRSDRQTQTGVNMNKNGTQISQDVWDDPWPRHLFMTGRKNAHKKSAQDSTGCGILHVDRKTLKLRWREVKHVNGNRRRKRSFKETIDLGITDLKVDFDQQVISDRETTSFIKIWHAGRNGQATVQFCAGYSSESAYLWANNDKKAYEHRNSFDDVEVIVEEVKRCIDKTTGRPSSVSKPKTELPFRIQTSHPSKRNSSSSDEHIETHVKAAKKRRVVRLNTSKESIEDTTPKPGHDWTDPWPRYMFLRGHRITPSPLGPGQLYVDRKTHKLYSQYYMDALNDPSMARIVDLSDPRTEIKYEADIASLTIWCPELRSGRQSKQCLLYFQHGYTPMMWMSNDTTAATFRMKDIKILLEEIMICIDKSSGRACSIPNPRTLNRVISDEYDVPGDPLPPGILIEGNSSEDVEQSTGAKDPSGIPDNNKGSRGNEREYQSVEYLAELYSR